MKLSNFLSAAVLLAGVGSASPLINSTGLASPTSNVTFNEIVLPAFTSLTNQYASMGVTFAASSYDPQSCAGFQGFTGSHCAGNRGPSNPFSILFTTPQTAAAMAFATDPQTTTLTAFLSGVQVETFSQATTFDNPNTAYLGFTGITFDQIQISLATSGTAAVFANIQMGGASASSTPEPVTVGLSGLALAMIGIARRLGISRPPAGT